MSPMTEMVFYVCAQAANILFFLIVAGLSAWLLVALLRKPPGPRLRNSLMRELLEPECDRAAYEPRPDPVSARERMRQMNRRRGPLNEAESLSRAHR